MRSIYDENGTRGAFFDTLKVGQIFEVEGEEYIKIVPLWDNLDNPINCIHGEKYTPAYFDAEYTRVRVKACYDMES